MRYRSGARELTYPSSKKSHLDQCCGRITLMRIRIRLVTLMRARIRMQILASKIRCSNRIIFHTFWLDCKLMRIRFWIQLINFYADPDQNFYLMQMPIRMRIQVTKIMRILADPDPRTTTLIWTTYDLRKSKLLETLILRGNFFKKISVGLFMRYFNCFA